MSGASDSGAGQGRRELGALQIVQLFKLPSAMAHGIQILHTAHAVAALGPRVHVHVQVPKGVAGAELAAEVLGRDPHENLHLHGFTSTHKGLVGLRSRLASMGAMLRARSRGAPAFGFYGRQRRQTSSVLGLRRCLGLDRSKCPVVYEFHNLDHVNAEQEGRARQAARIRAEEGRLARDCDALTAISQPLAEDLVQSFDLDRAPLLVPDGVDLGHFDRARIQGRSRAPEVTAPETKTPNSKTPLRIAYAGSLHTHKGVDSLLEAFSSMEGELELRIIGGHPEARLAELRTRVELDPSLAHRVVLLGQRPAPSVAEELCGADVILLPSAEARRSERYTSPLKLFEAMATGVPIVASPSAAHRSVLRDGVTAYMAESPAPKDMGNALRRCLEDREEGRGIAEAALKEVQGYGWNQRAKTILGLFEGLLERS